FWSLGPPGRAGCGDGRSANPFGITGIGLSGLDFVAPGVGGDVADHLLGAVDRQQRAVLGDLAVERDVGEDLGEQVARRAVHHRVGGGDDDVPAAGDVGFQAEAAGGRDVADVDVAPRVPLARVRVRPVAGEAVVFVRLHDVGDT